MCHFGEGAKWPEKVQREDRSKFSCHVAVTLKCLAMPVPAGHRLGYRNFTEPDILHRQREPRR
jgi:hypothetical protein